MSHFKRKWKDIEDSDEESPAYGKQILPVANLSQDFNDEPRDGMQYLFMVRRDARQLPSTVRVPNPYEKPELEMSIVAEVANPQSSSSQSQLPSEEWLQVFERRFQNFRKNFEQPTTYVGPINPPQNRLIPDKKDRDLWWSFLAGRPDSEWNLSKKSKNKLKKQTASRGMYGWGDESSNADRTVPSITASWNNDEGEVEEVLKIDPAETLPSPVGTPVPLDHLEVIIQPSSTPTPLIPALPEEEKLVSREPTPQLLKLIDERAALHILMYFAYWINIHLSSPESSAYMPTESHGRWIFCLLSRIDDFIAPDDMNLLRNLARACILLLKHVKKLENEVISPEVSTYNAMSETSCWVIISIVAGVWKQKDLWMDAEDALRST